MSGRGAAWMAAAFAFAAFAHSASSLPVIVLAVVGLPVSTLVTTSIALEIAGHLIAFGVLGLTLKRVARSDEGPSWILIVVAAIAALLAYPIGTATGYATTIVLSGQGSEMLAEWAIANAWVSAGTVLGHTLWLFAAVIGAALVQRQESAAPERDLVD